MEAYLISTPKNPKYSGKFFGLQFSGGRSVLAEGTLDESLGWTVEQIKEAIEREDYPGYVLTPLSKANADFIDALNNKGEDEDVKAKRASKVKKA